MPEIRKEKHYPARAVVHLEYLQRHLSGKHPELIKIIPACGLFSPRSWRTWIDFSGNNILTLNRKDKIEIQRNGLLKEVVKHGDPFRHLPTQDLLNDCLVHVQVNGMIWLSEMSLHLILGQDNVLRCRLQMGQQELCIQPLEVDYDLLALVFNENFLDKFVIGNSIFFPYPFKLTSTCRIVRKSND